MASKCNIQNGSISELFSMLKLIKIHIFLLTSYRKLKYFCLSSRGIIDIYNFYSLLVKALTILYIPTCKKGCHFCRYFLFILKLYSKHVHQKNCHRTNNKKKNFLKYHPAHIPQNTVYYVIYTCYSCYTWMEIL